MARGWFISAHTPNSGAGNSSVGNSGVGNPGVASTPRVRFLVAIHDRDAALRAIEAWYPGSRVVVDGEATGESIAKHRVRDGTIFMLDNEA
jgi:hypothetical protein